MSPADDLAAVSVKTAPFKPLPQKAPDLSVERREDGTIYVRSNHPPGEGPRSIAHLLAERAAQHPDRRVRRASPRASARTSTPTRRTRARSPG